MFCMEQEKIYREPKFGSDRAPFSGWFTNIGGQNTNAQIKPNFNQNGQI